jgi:SAM-dependent methyltransferase
VKVFYDRKNNRLAYIEKKASSDYWDKHWEEYNFERTYPKKINPFDFIVKYTKKLPEGCKILEGGCGMGQNVYKLQKIGYNVIGVDYAEKTVDLIKSRFPELNVINGDVRNLPFSDEYFDGYWSIGVIEHFYEGYGEIIKEMYRIVRWICFCYFPTYVQIKTNKIKIC